MRSREPRCHQNGMDARRRDAAKAGRLGKERNDADARFGDNPPGAVGARERCCLVLMCINTRRPRRLPCAARTPLAVTRAHEIASNARRPLSSLA